MTTELLHNFMSGIVAIALLVAVAVAVYIVACVIAWTAKDSEYDDFAKDEKEDE